MKRYVKCYDTGLSSFQSTVQEVLRNPQDSKHLRCFALSDILENALADARYSLNLEYEIDDSRFVLDGDASYKSAYTFVCALYVFKLDENNKPIFDSMSVNDKMRIRQHLLKVLDLPEDIAGNEQYSIDISFFYSYNRERPCVEIVLYRSNLSNF